MRFRLENVGFRYGRRSALQAVDWAVGPGITGLLGPNGAGKTTLLNLLVGLTRPSTGRIVVEGNGERSGRVGFLPQRFSLASEMRAHDTIAYAAWINGVPRRDCDAAAHRALSAVSIQDSSRARVRTLSGGQRQRLGIAAALAHDPTILVLDEPTAGLDPGQRLRVREVIAEVGKSHTVVLSTHLVEDIAHLCDRVGVINAGRMVFDGSSEELISMVDDTEAEGALGSPFERAYDALMSRLGSRDE